jgi:uncharacterized protein YcfJ
MSWKKSFCLLLIFAVMSGCATMPAGPTVSVMPAQGKPFDVFMSDDQVCREWASRQIGGTSPSQNANENVASGAVLGTVIGAGLGALIGSTTGNAGAGAAIGAGAGLLGGTSIGANAGAASGYDLQRRYDIAYQQCMYSRGNQIPGVASRSYTPPPPPPPSKSQTSVGPVYIYPRQGQNRELMAKDRSECYSWAVGQTGYDPVKPPADNTPGPQKAQMSADFDRAMGACLDGRGYTVR